MDHVPLAGDSPFTDPDARRQSASVQDHADGTQPSTTASAESGDAPLEMRGRNFGYAHHNAGVPIIAPQPHRYSGLSPSLQDNSARNSYVPTGTPDPSRGFLASENQSLVNEKGTNTPGHGVVGDEYPATATRSHRRRWCIILFILAAIIIVALAVVLPIIFLVVKKHHHSGAAGAAGSSGGGKGPASNPESPTGATTGSDGSTIVMEDGTSFTYKNQFGGFWVDDPKDPFNNGARAQSFTPALNETWDYAVDQIRGVNLGGWLVLEPFIVPALFEKYNNVTPNAAIPSGQAVDEWSLSIAMLNDTSPGGGISQLEDHYKTFITEQDFAEIAGAGLNWVRLPVPYWAIEAWPGEPFLARTAWTYVLKALHWARKYGLRVYLELHTAPGSQNGYNHSGRSGPINFLNGPMGIANAQRVLTYDRVLMEFISQKEYQSVVQMFGVLNEPLMGIIGRDQLDRYYLQTYEMLRDITGIGNGAYMVMHDGFLGLGPWKDYLPGADRLILDTHPYIAFGGGLDQPIDYWPPAACRAFQVNQSNIDFGITITGEFSSAINDCGKWIHGVGAEPSAENCDTWDDWPNWTQDMVQGILQFTMASMDAMHFPGYFFWTWKIGNSSVTGKVEAPMWSYQLGLQQGWVPQDPRTAIGMCDSLDVPFNLPVTSYQPWQTGGAGAGQVAATAVAALSQYPPPQISNVNNADPLLLPQYTDTSAMPTLPTETFSAATTTGGDGWADPSDTALAAAPIPGCVYPDAWFGPVASTQFICGAAAQQTPPPA